MVKDALSQSKFNEIVDGLLTGYASCQAIAVAVSGGPDSMALCHLLAQWGNARSIDVHALSVDHGLRKESADEAEQVGVWLSALGVQHQVLRWDTPSEKRVQEEARKARYAMMARYCAEHDIRALFLGHHMDDQAETVLFRLAKGSGLDGLVGMRAVQNYDENLCLMRPLLNATKSDILDFCARSGISFVQDPSNESDQYSRVRLRRARSVLEEEGLSAKRLSVTARRLLRARNALDEIAKKTYEKNAVEINSKRVVFDVNALSTCPEEIVLRVILRGMEMFRHGANYAPRMERVEGLVSNLLGAMRDAQTFRKRTLGGVVFEYDHKKAHFILEKE